MVPPKLLLASMTACFCSGVLSPPSPCRRLRSSRSGAASAPRRSGRRPPAPVRPPTSRPRPGSASGRRGAGAGSRRRPTCAFTFCCFDVERVVAAAARRDSDEARRAPAATPFLFSSYSSSNLTMPSRARARGQTRLPLETSRSRFTRNFQPVNRLDDALDLRQVGREQFVRLALAERVRAALAQREDALEEARRRARAAGRPRARCRASSTGGSSPCRISTGAKSAAKLDRLSLIRSRSLSADDDAGM